MAANDFENLLKTVASLNTQLESANRLIQDLQTKMSRTSQVGLSRQVQNLQSYVKNLQEQQVAASRAIETISSKSVSSGLSAAVQRYLAANVPPPPAQAQPNLPYNRGFRPAPSSGPFADIYGNEGVVNKIPGGFGTSTKAVMDAQTLYAKALRDDIDAHRRVREALQEQEKATRGRGDFYKDLRADFTKGVKPPALLFEEKAVSAREVAERQRLQALQSSVQAEKRYAQALELAARQGFTVSDLKNIRTRGTGDIRQLQFQRTGDSGVRQNLDIFTTPAGRATAGASNQFRTFGQGVVRDIGELTKWSIALAAVYGPMRKVQELTQIMIENQTRLAEATISVNSSFTGQAEIFDIAAEAANRAGEEVSGVIDAFTQAYRAAGGTGDEVERLSIATTLLNDSLILSKLSSLDQAAAIDTLSAAIRQTGGDFSKTTELLDSWVRVTKVANVDLTTLSTGFAVLGDAAETAGITTHELNGLIATIAESSQSSGKEVANMARALVGGLQSQQGVAALEELGIAATDTEGNMRSLQEILVEISSLREIGAISDTQLSRLGQQVGGGVRRGAIVTTIFENYGRAIEVANQSSKAGGDAQAALAKQLETVQTSLTRLNNAFEELAQSLGTEGGFLGIIQESIDGMATLVKLFDGLVGVLGKATPAMLAFVAASLVLRSKGLGGAQQALGGLGQFIQPTEEQLLLQRLQGPQTIGQRGRQFVGQNVLGSNISSGIFQGALMSVLPLIQNLTNTDDRFGKTRATADIIGGVGGGIIGSLVAGSPLIGAAIGTAVAEAFINTTVARKTDIFGYAAPGLGEPLGDLGGVAEDPDEALRQAEINLYKSIGFGNEGIGRILTSGIGEQQEALVEELNEAIRSGNEDAFNEIISRRTGPGGTVSILQGTGISQELAQQAFQQRRPLEFSSQSPAYQRASEEARREYDAALAARTAQGDVEGVRTPFIDLVEKNTQAFAPIIQSVRDLARETISGERLTGDLRGSEFVRQTKANQGFDTKALEYFTAFGDEFIKINKDVDDATDAFKAFSDIVLYGSAESVQELTGISGEIQNLINLLNDPAITEEKLIELGFTGRADVQGQLAELQSVAAQFTSDLYGQAALSRVPIPEVRGDLTQPLATNELQLVIERTIGLEENFYQDLLGLTEEQLGLVREGFDEWAQIVEESGDVFFQKVAGRDPQLFQQALAQLIEEGKIASQQANPFGIQQLDITSQQGAGLQGQIDYFSQYLSQNFPQYEQKPEDIGVIFSDYVTDVLHGDNLAIKLALQRIAELEQKQLDGMYNIPEGATFWVPLTAAYYRPKQGEGQGGLGEIDTKPLDNSAQNLDQAAMNLSMAAELMKQRDIEVARHSYGLQSTRGRQADADRYTAMAEEYKRREAETQSALQTYRAGEKDYVPGAAGGRPAQAAEGGRLEGFLQNILTEIRNLFSQQGVSGPPGKGYGGGAGEAGGRVQGLTGMVAGQQVNPQVNARIELKVDSSTQLLVDGRVLASIVTPYLAADLLRLEASQGTITRRYVI